MSITFAVFFLLLFILSTYRDRLRNVLVKNSRKKSDFLPLLILAIIVIPVIVMNGGFSVKYFDNPKDKMERAQRYKNIKLYHEAFLEYAENNLFPPFKQRCVYSLETNNYDSQLK